MTGRNATRLAWSLAGLTVAILLAALLFLILSFDTPLREESFGFRGWGLILAAAFAIAGGVGFDPAAADRGSGLQGLADRLAALGGELRVRSTVGAGTTILGTLPVERTP